MPHQSYIILFRWPNTSSNDAKHLNSDYAGIHDLLHRVIVRHRLDLLGEINLLVHLRQNHSLDLSGC